MLSTSSGRSLQGKRVLVVEDEPFIAFDLVDGIEQAEGQPVGPAMSIAAALSMVMNEQIDGAILDVNLPDGDITPVVTALLERHVAFVIHTGAGLTAQLEAFKPPLPVFAKPTPPARLVHFLASRI